MPRPTYAEINLKSLLHNLHVLQQQSNICSILAMVKANAYGHGITKIASALAPHVKGLGVASINEALKLREHGIQTPITLIEGIFEENELDIVSANNFTVIFHSEYQVEWLLGQKLTQPIDAWIKINTGMCRLGFSPEKYQEQYHKLTASANIKSLGVMSHFACADEKQHPLNPQQIQKFIDSTHSINSPRSLCNSAAIFNFPEQHYDMIRPGLALYGASPFAKISAESLKLKPVMTLKSAIIAIHQLNEGETIGYGARYKCAAPTKIGVVAIGYGDGYPRNAKDGTPTLVNNQICSVAGKVSMDMITIDLTNSPDAQIGDEVTLWGEGLPIEQVMIHTSHSVYDLLTGIQRRAKYIYTE